MDTFDSSSFAGDASQRVHAIVSAAEAEAAGLLRDAEREADLIRRGARAEGDQVVEDARRRADEIVAERVQRIGELSDGIVKGTEVLLDQMDAAGHVRRQLDGLLRSLGESAEAVSRESGRHGVPRDAGQQPRSAPPPPPSRQEAPPRRYEAPRREAAPAAGTPPAEAPPAQSAPPSPPPPRPPAQSQPPQKPAAQSAPEPARRPDEAADSRFDGARLVALQMAVAGSTREEVHAELQRAFRIADPSSILDDVFGGPRRASALN